MGATIICPKCKTTKNMHPTMVMMVNDVCGHALCRVCVKLFYGSGPPRECAMGNCYAHLSMQNFRVVLFDDLAVDKEVHIRKEVQGRNDLIQRDKNKAKEPAMKERASSLRLQRVIAEKEDIKKKGEANKKLVDLLMVSDDSTEDNQDIVAPPKQSVAAQEQHRKETSKASNSGGSSEDHSSYILGSPREDLNNSSGLPLSSHEMAHNDGHSKMRLQVDPGGLITGESISQEVQEFLMDISEPVCRLEHNQEYQLTRYSLYAATCQGLQTDAIIQKLELLSKKKLPIEVIDLIKSTLHGTVKLVRKQNSFFVESTHPVAIRELLKDEEIQECRLRPSDETVGYEEQDVSVQFFEALDMEEENPDLIYFEVKREKVESLLRRCKVLEFLLPLEYDYQHDTCSKNTNIDLKKGAVLRPYQEKALQKMFSSGRARSGIIALPCGAGKSLLGVKVFCMIGKRALVFCDTNMAAEHWKQQLLMWSTVKEEMICIVTSDMSKEKYVDCSIFIATYDMIAYTKERRVRTERTMSWLKNQTWGIILLDEVHTVPADTFKELLMTVQAGCKLGLTATMVREDEKIDDLNFIIGPKLYEADWMQLENEGYIAKASCYVVPVSLTSEFFLEYENCQQPIKKKDLFYILHPLKFQVCQFLINYHEKRGDKIIVFLDNVFALRFYAEKLKKPFIDGDVKVKERLRILEDFKSGSGGNTIFLSRVGDTSIDLPDARVIIQVSFHDGSRRQEAQRLGRILRCKDDTNNNDCYFYTLVSRNTPEEEYSKNRQSFLVNKGYTYQTLTVPELRTTYGMKDDKKLQFKSKKDQKELLTTVKNHVEPAEPAELAEPDELVEPAEPVEGSPSPFPQVQSVPCPSGTLSKMPPKRKCSSPNTDGESRMKAQRTESGKAYPSSQRVDISKQVDSSQRVDSISHFHIIDAINLLKTKYFKSKDVIELLEWDTIVEEVMKGKVLDPEAEKDFKYTLSKHPRVKVRGSPPDVLQYCYNPQYDIHDGRSLLLKLRNLGALVREHITSSLYNAEKILSRVGNKIVKFPPTKTLKNTDVLHYNAEAKVVDYNFVLDKETKEQWDRTPIPGELGVDDYKEMEKCLKQRRIAHLQQDISLDHLPKKLKLKLQQLPRLLVVAFNTVQVQQALIVERVLHFECLDEKTLAVLLNFKGDELKECLDKLVKDRILQEEYLDGSDEKFYFVSYQKLFCLVRYKLDEMRKKREEDLWPSYFCLNPKCNKGFEQDFSGRLLCPNCKSGLELVTPKNRKTSIEILNEKMQPLHRLLEEIEQDFEGLKLVPGILKPQPAHPNRFHRDKSEYLTVKPEICLAFYFEVMQNTTQDHSDTMIEAAWQENAALTLKLIFQLRDNRRGEAAKLKFYHCLSWLYKNHFQTLLKNLEHLPLHGYWKDLLWLVHFTMTGQVVLMTKQQVSAEKKETEEQQIDYETVALEEVIRKISNLMKKDEKFSLVYKAVVRIFTKALKYDVEVLENKEELELTALAGKWAPSIDSSFDFSTQLGRSIARSLFRKKTAGETAEDYDKKAFSSYQSKYLGPLRDTIEIAIVDKHKWSEFNYERVPSVDMKRYEKMSYARDEEHFKGILEVVKKGEKKIASGALLPHEIVNEYMKGGEIAKELEDVSEMQWKSYVDNLKKVGMLESALAVCDVSGSINGDPMMNVAIALSLLIADLSKPPFDGLVRSFSPGPQLYAVKQQSLKEKVEFTRRMVGGMSTNLMAVFNLILNKARADKLKPSKMVKTIFIFSDMEFDECGGQHYETDYMLIQRKFVGAGYPLPGVVFWNLRGGDRSKPVTKQEKNVTMVSGFSGQMLRTFLENGKFNSPDESMLDTLGKHYDHLEVVD